MVYAGSLTYFHKAVTDASAAAATGASVSFMRQNRIQSDLAAYKLSNTVTPIVVTVQSNNPVVKLQKFI